MLIVLNCINKHKIKLIISNSFDAKQLQEVYET